MSVVATQRLARSGAENVPAVDFARRRWLEWREPPDFVRQRYAAAIAKLSRRERFLSTHFVSIAVGLALIIKHVFALPVPHFSDLGALLVMVGSSTLLHFLWFRLYQWMPYSRVVFVREGVSFGSFMGNVGCRYKWLTGYVLEQRDDYLVLRLRRRGDQEIELALPDAHWGEPVEAVMAFVKVPRMAD